MQPTSVPSRSRASSALSDDIRYRLIRSGVEHLRSIPSLRNILRQLQRDLSKGGRNGGTNTNYDQGQNVDCSMNFLKKRNLYLCKGSHLVYKPFPSRQCHKNIERKNSVPLIRVARGETSRRKEKRSPSFSRPSPNLSMPLFDIPVKPRNSGKCSGYEFWKNKVDRSA